MSKVISADVPDDLADRIEAEQEDGESRSACVRRLIRDGLDAEDRTERPAYVLPLYFTGVVILSGGLLTIHPRTTAIALGAVYLALGAALSRERVRQTLHRWAEKTHLTD